MVGSRTARLAHLLALTLALLVLLPGIALADVVSNDVIVDVGSGEKIRTITAGGSANVTYTISTTDGADPVNGCNATGSAPATFRLSLSADVTASPSSWTRTGCSDQIVGFSSSTPGTYTITLSVTGGRTNSTWNTSDATFKLVVEPVGPPPDTTAPFVTVPAPITTEATGPGGASVTFTASATDDVDGPLTPTCVPASGSTFPLGATTVACSATDAAGNTGSNSFTVTVVDTTAPIVDVPAAIVAEATSASGAAVSYSGASAVDLVDGALTPDCLPASGSTFALGTTTVTCSATDASGNTGSNWFTITVQDTTAPTVTAPADKTVEATSGSGAAVGYANATATDLVDGTVTATCAPPSGSTFPLGTTTVTCSATDAAGNTGEDFFDITVEDTTAPIVSAPADITGVEATGPSGAAVTYPGATAEDAVDGTLTAVCAPASGTTFPLGTTVVTCSATDGAGNIGQDTFSITVVDTTAPAVTPPADITAEATSAAGAAVSYSGAAATDIVDGSLTPTCTPPSGSTFPLGATTVTCSATDAAGNTGTASFSITVVDTTPPAVTPPGNITAEATSAAGAAVIYSGATASDLVDGSIAASCAPVSGSTFPLGVTTVTCSATDAAGNTGTASFSITVVDTTPPVVTVPANKIVEATGPGGAAVSFSASATDLVDGAVAPTCAPPSGSTFSLGTTVVSCSATDAAGNTGSAQFDISVIDTTPPAVTVPADMTQEATGPSGAVATFSASATDLVDGSITPNCTPPSGSTFPLGATAVTCSATDAAGNTGSESFTITVVDTTAPVVTVPANLSVLATSASGAPVTFSASAEDIVEGTISPTCSKASGSTFAPGITTVTCSATDAAGNTGSASFTVTVGFDWSGFFAPVDKGIHNLVKAGATVPLKFSVQAANGSYIRDLSIVAFKTATIPCDSTLGTDEVEMTSAGGTQLRYETSAEQFIQNWQTPKMPGKCARATITLTSGDKIWADFRLK
jgi:hypothetical protein